MQKILIVIAILAISNISEAKKDSLATGKWTYELLYAPNLSYRLLTTSDDEQWHKEDRNARETVRFGYSAKFGIIRRLNAKWSIGAGLSFTSIGFKTKESDLTWDTPEEGFPVALRSTSKYFYIGLPVTAYYVLKENKRWTSELIFGASINRYENKNVISEIKVGDEWTSYSNKGAIYNPVNYFAILGIGNSYRVNKRLLVKGNLMLNQSFTPTNSMSATKEYLNFLGLNIGVNYSFHKRK